jgi:hypothetical protein
MEQLMQLRAVGQVGAQRLLLELFWRQFNNRREVGACVVLAFGLFHRLSLMLFYDGRRTISRIGRPGETMLEGGVMRDRYTARG